MKLAEAMAQLEAAGTAQNRKTYVNHGVQGDQFGVSFAALDRLAKQIKRDHGLAVELWATGNQDARLLATRIADPAALSSADLDAWARDLDNYIVTDAFSGLVARSPLARPKMESWTGDEDEWIGAAGWNIMAHLALNDETLPDAYFLPYLDVIDARNSRAQEPRALLDEQRAHRHRLAQPGAGDFRALQRGSGGRCGCRSPEDRLQDPRRIELHPEGLGSPRETCGQRRRVTRQSPASCRLSSVTRFLGFAGNRVSAL